MASKKGFPCHSVLSIFNLPEMEYNFQQKFWQKNLAKLQTPHLGYFSARSPNPLYWCNVLTWISLSALSGGGIFSSFILCFKATLSHLNTGFLATLDVICPSFVRFNSFCAAGAPQEPRRPNHGTGQGPGRPRQPNRSKIEPAARAATQLCKGHHAPISWSEM